MHFIKNGSVGASYGSRGDEVSRKGVEGMEEGKYCIKGQS